MTQAYQYFGGFQPTQRAFSLGEATQAVNANRQLDAKRDEKQARMAYFQGLGDDATEDQYAQGVAEFPEHEKMIRDHQERSFQGKLGQVINGDMDVDDLRKSRPGQWKQIQEGMAANDQFQNEAVGQIASRVAFAAENDDSKTMKRELESARTVFEAEGNQFALSTIDTQLENLNSGDPERMKKAGKSAKGLWALSSEESYKKWSDNKATESTTRYTDHKTGMLEKDHQVKVNTLKARMDELKVSQQNADSTEEKNVIAREVNETTRQLAKLASKKLSPTELKSIDDLSVKQKDLDTQFTQVSELLEKVDSVDRSTGTAAKVGEVVKAMFGTEDEQTLFRTQTTGLINKLTRGQRVPGEGTMTEADMKLLKAAYLDPDANTEPLKKMFGAIKRLTAFNSSMNRLEVEWKKRIPGNGIYKDVKDEEPIIINGYKPKHKESFDQFSRRLENKIYEDAVKLPEFGGGKQTATSSGFQVPVPGGKVYSFPTQEAADRFKAKVAEAGK
jgi:hypothetical protein